MNEELKKNRWTHTPSQATQEWLDYWFEKVLKRINENPEFRRLLFRPWLHDTIREEGKGQARSEFVEAIFEALQCIESETWKRIAKDFRCYFESVTFYPLFDELRFRIIDWRKCLCSKVQRNRSCMSSHRSQPLRDSAYGK